MNLILVYELQMNKNGSKINYATIEGFCETGRG